MSNNTRGRCKQLSISAAVTTSIVPAFGKDRRVTETGGTQVNVACRHLEQVI